MIQLHVYEDNSGAELILPEMPLTQRADGSVVNGLLLRPEAAMQLGSRLIAFAMAAAAAQARRCAEIADGVSERAWEAYKHGSDPERGDSHQEGIADGAEAVAKAIRAEFGLDNEASKP